MLIALHPDNSRNSERGQPSMGKSSHIHTSKNAIILFDESEDTFVNAVSGIRTARGELRKVVLRATTTPTTVPSRCAIISYSNFRLNIFLDKCVSLSSKEM